MMYLTTAYKGVERSTGCCQTHNLKVVGSNPTPATRFPVLSMRYGGFNFVASLNQILLATIWQPYGRISASFPVCPVLPTRWYGNRYGVAYYTAAW